jgi:hypothetical protein
MGADNDMTTKYYNEEASISAWWVTFKTPQVRPHTQLRSLKQDGFQVF